MFLIFDGLCGGIFIKLIDQPCIATLVVFRGGTEKVYRRTMQRCQTHQSTGRTLKQLLRAAIVRFQWEADKMKVNLLDCFSFSETFFSVVN